MTLFQKKGIRRLDGNKTKPADPSRARDWTCLLEIPAFQLICTTMRRINGSESINIIFLPTPLPLGILKKTFDKRIESMLRRVASQPLTICGYCESQSDACAQGSRFNQCGGEPRPSDMKRT